MAPCFNEATHSSGCHLLAFRYYPRITVAMVIRDISRDEKEENQ